MTRVNESGLERVSRELMRAVLIIQEADPLYHQPGSAAPVPGCRLFRQDTDLFSLTSENIFFLTRVIS